MFYIILAIIASISLFLFINYIKNRKFRYDVNRRCKKLLKSSFSLTPKGVKIYTEKGDLSQDELGAIDAGLSNTFRKCVRDYPHSVGRPGTNHSDYAVFMLESERTPNGNYGFRVPVDGYEGTIWDQGGYLYAGAMMVPMIERIYTIALPYQPADKLLDLKNGADYEGEHWVLATFDGAKYEATKIHGQGQGHPIMSEAYTSLAGIPQAVSINPDYGVTIDMMKQGDTYVVATTCMQVVK